MDPKPLETILVKALVVWGCMSRLDVDVATSAATNVGQRSVLLT